MAKSQIGAGAKHRKHTGKGHNGNQAPQYFITFYFAEYLLHSFFLEIAHRLFKLSSAVFVIFKLIKAGTGGTQ